EVVDDQGGSGPGIGVGVQDTAAPDEVLAACAVALLDGGERIRAAARNIAVGADAVVAPDDVVVLTGTAAHDVLAREAAPDDVVGVEAAPDDVVASVTLAAAAPDDVVAVVGLCRAPHDAAVPRVGVGQRHTA